MNPIRHALIALLVVCSPCFAGVDDWVANRLDNGEFVYKSGHYDKLYFGARGVGFVTTQAMYSEDSAYVIVDDGKPIFSQLEAPATRGIYLFKNSKELAPLVAKANKVEIRFKTCGSYSTGVGFDCFYSAAGEPYSVTWQFPRVLSDVMANPPSGN